MPHARTLIVALIGVLLCVCPARAADQAYGRSWIWIDPACNTRILTSGETWEVPIEYDLDPADAPLARSLDVFIAGPWIDGPDGKYVKDRQHMNYPGLGATLSAKPGRHRETLRFTVPPAKPQGNSLLIIAAFSGEKGRWPWEARFGGISLVRNDGYFELETAQPGNLFTYDQPVEFTIALKNPAPVGKTLLYQVHDAAGAIAAQGKLALDASAKEAKLPLNLQSNGIFLLTASVDGWEQRQATFARIPDVLAMTGTGRTAFGMTNVITPRPRQIVEEECRIARMLGLSACRIMARWDEFEPGRGVYKLDAWQEPLDLARQYGIAPVLMVDHPPAWAQNNPPRNVQYAPFDADLEGWRQFVETATGAFKGRLYGWEWLNEIVPGDDKNAVANYINLCRVGTEAAKKVDPSIITTAAGGLWPRSYRTDLLAAGLAKYFDVLPVHYSDAAGVRQARTDLQAVGANLPIWDNETSTVLNAWDVPKLEQIADTTQPRWLLTHWTEELTAGADRIFFFGGPSDPAGNWSYLLGDQTPRPVAVTLAVLASKLHNAKPLGAFTLGHDSKLHLFERDGQVTLVAWAPRNASIELATGDHSLTLTNYLGNTAIVQPNNGIASVNLSSMPIFIEGADPDTLRTFVALSSLASEDATRPARLTFVRDRENQFQVRVSNPYSREFAGRVTVQPPQGWPAITPTDFRLAQGDSRIVTITIPLQTPASGKEEPLVVSLEPADQNLPQVHLNMAATLVAPEMLGNLLPNGSFELGEGAKAANWGGQGQRVSAQDQGEGFGQYLLRFGPTQGNYRDSSNAIRLAGGQTYLYSAWVANDDMQAGSNIAMTMKDGSTRMLYNVQVFVTSPSHPTWQLYTAHLDGPPDMVAASFVPVNKGDGWAMYDNVRVTRYVGTDYMAEAYKGATPVKVDGDISDFPRQCPIPLLGSNQLSGVAPAYTWSPKSLSGIAYLAWDDANLYLAVRVNDDKHFAKTTGEQAIEGDSLLIAIDPTGKAPDAAEKSFCYYVTAVNPGSGGGKYTIYRPSAHSGGLSSGHLLKDSSVYDLAVKREEGVTTYELRIPWNELGTLRPGLGTQFGFTLQVNDNDGTGIGARMAWGQGVAPAWQPANFGLVTLMDGAR